MRYLYIAVTGLILMAGSAAANQQFHTAQPFAGRANNQWAFITAWNLASGGLEVSPNWYNGRHVWSHSTASLNQWIARFVYDQAAGKTRELAWYYSQVHVQ